jgi:hypothetical protein
LIEEGRAAHEVGKIYQLTQCDYIAGGKVSFYNAPVTLSFDDRLDKKWKKKDNGGVSCADSYQT